MHTNFPCNKWIVLSAILLTSFTAANARIISYKKNAAEVIFNLDKGLMSVKICKADLIEVKYTILNTIPEKKSLVINNTWNGKVPFTLSSNQAEFIITTSRLIIHVNKSTNAISYYDKKDNLITAEGQENKTMDSTTIAGIHTYNCNTQFVSPADEALYGLGCHPEDTLSINYKGRNQELLIKYLTGAIPVLLSTKGYGLLWDNYSASNFYGTEANNTQYKYVSESGKMVDYYFFYGPDFDHIIDLYRTATGKAPMFPKWAFGLFQSQDRYKTEDEVLSVKDGYRKNHIPVDVIVQDWFWWSPLPIGSHIMNPERYPTPKRMVDELHKANLHAMISIWPVFGKNTNDYNALKRNGFLTSITWDNFFAHTFDTYYDAHNPAARAMYWQQAKDSIIKRYGWDAWWVDQCEPDNGALLDERRKANFSVGKGIDYFNTYSLEHAKGLYKGWRSDIPAKRAFFLIRQAFAGSQRSAATLWSSDITCTFRALKSQVPQAINACASGIPYWTSDIGGYLSRVSKDGIPDWSEPKYRELFTRWFQFGTFSPIFRIHGKGERAIFSDNWDAQTKTILLKYDDLRYRLLPYIYSLSAKVTMDNYTILRSLAFDFRNDPAIYSIPDQYMFGPAFMVSPVTEQMYSDATATSNSTTRNVYLPKGADWYDFWKGNKLTGGQTVSADASIDILPLYIKAGSILPMGPKMEYTTQRPADTIELRIYPGANGSFKFYEDANDNYNYEKGEYATFNFTWNDVKKQLNISARKGSFPGMLQKRIFNIVVVGDTHGIGVNEEKADKIIEYSGKSIDVKL